MIDENMDATVPTTSRKDLLKKIGVALTAASLGSLSSVAAAGAGTGQRRPQLPKSLPTALSAHEGQHYFIWFGLGKVSSALVDDAQAVEITARGPPKPAWFAKSTATLEAVAVGVASGGNAARDPSLRD